MQKKRKIWLSLLIFFLVIIFVLVYLGYTTSKQFSWHKLLQSNFVQRQVDEENRDLFNLLPRFLGFDKSMTYLVLFENNTELRPGGGFIGVYGVIKLNQGHLEVVQLEGTENLDRNTPDGWRPVPPQPLSEHLKVDRWYFRDANWSPDFTQSAAKALELYQAEGGVEAEGIDAVVAFTPTVLEELLKITGPLIIQDLEFTSDNVTEKLEYEVEYGYDDKGLAFHERKQIIQPFFSTLVNTVSSDLFNLPVYLKLLDKLAGEKHILVYTSDPDLQKVITAKNWTGQLAQVKSDYLLWVDANLAALKTDHAIIRTLTYKLTPQTDDRYLATTEMEYQHTGSFDWRTSRYRTYARVFVPKGSQLVTAGFDQGEELDKTWFGKFISIEHGQSKTLRVEYFLSADIAEQIANNLYTLFVQKQLGTIAHELTLDLDFGKNIWSALPAENQSNYGDAVYTLQTDLRVDRKFSIEF